MAKKDPEEKLEYEEEAYDEAYDDDDEAPESGPSWKMWAIIGAIGLLIVCVGLGAMAYFARDSIMAMAGLNPTATATATFTALPPTATATLEPTATATLAPTATMEPSPTPLLLPPQEVMAIVDGAPIVNEQFDDNARNWTSMMQGSEYTIQQGMMVFRSGQPGQPAVVYCVTDCGPFEDRYFYQAEMNDERGADAGYGLVFGLDPQRNVYYVFSVRPTKSQYGLFKVQGTQITPLLDWTQTSALLPSPQNNALGVRFVEKKIDLFINNTWVNEKVDNLPLATGRVGLFVEQDGVRLMANQIKVFGLIDITPEPPGTRPTSAPPAAIPTQAPPPAAGAPTLAPPPAGAPTAAGFPTPTQALPTASNRFTPTPTVYGACPNNMPAGTWALVITKTGNTARPGEVTINGTVYKLTDLNTVFYLNQNVNYTVVLGSKSFDFFYSTCKIIYKKINVR